MSRAPAPRLLRGPRKRLAVCPVALCFLLIASAFAATASAAPTPTTTGPITGGENGRPATSVSPPIEPLFKKYGYVQREYFVNGTARAFSSAAPLTSDGKWTLSPSATAPYKTRILTRLPKHGFNGTVYVEWLNVSQGFDVDVVFDVADKELLREGYGWVGVDAQKVGIYGAPAGGGLALPGFGLKDWDPTRYGTLSHPGDSFSYDIFSQVAEALKHPKGVDPLQSVRGGGHHGWNKHRRGGKHRRYGHSSPSLKLIATGISQSAIRLATYVNAVAKSDDAYDGYLIAERGGGSALTEAPQPAVPAPSPLRIRTDLDVPVTQYNTESDVQYLGFWKDRQPATPKVRSWELALGVHNPQYLVDRNGPVIKRDYPDYETDTTGAGCNNPPAGGPETYVFSSLLRKTTNWTRGGRAPRQSPPIATGPTGVILRDEQANALGGIRTPWSEAPIATLTTENGPATCFLLGSTIPFSQATLDDLYSSHRDYVAQFSAATLSAAASGWILPDDVGGLIAKAAHAPVP